MYPVESLDYSRLKSIKSVEWLIQDRQTVFEKVAVREFFDGLMKAQVAVNLGAFVGHGSMRREIIGEDNRPATTEEMERMRRLVRQAMDEGALGLTGLFYIPGAFAPTEEFVELAKVAAAAGGMHISHMRDGAAGLLDSVGETIRIGEERHPPALPHDCPAFDSGASNCR